MRTFKEARTREAGGRRRKGRKMMEEFENDWNESENVLQRKKDMEFLLRNTHVITAECLKRS